MFALAYLKQKPSTKLDVKECNLLSAYPCQMVLVIKN